MGLRAEAANHGEDSTPVPSSANACTSSAVNRVQLGFERVSTKPMTNDQEFVQPLIDLLDQAASGAMPRFVWARRGMLLRRRRQRVALLEIWRRSCSIALGVRGDTGDVERFVIGATAASPVAAVRKDPVLIGTATYELQPAGSETRVASTMRVELARRLKVGARLLQPPLWL